MSSIRQTYIGKVNPRPWEYFGVVRLGMVLLGESQSGLHDRILASLTCDATERDHVVISRRQIDIGKENQRQHEHFDVARFSMALLDEPQFAVQDRMWAKNASYC